MQRGARPSPLCLDHRVLPTLTHLPEADLVRACRAGQRAAQHELYRRYARAMFGTCQRMCRSREDAEDCLQQAFSDVFRRLDGFRGEATVGAWIKRIVVNTCLTHLKRGGPRVIALEDAGAAYAKTVNAAAPPAEPDAAAEIARVRAAVATLPDGFRAVLTLYLFEGYDHGEIAAVLGISEQTSKSQYSRARKRLRERLAPNQAT